MVLVTGGTALPSSFKGTLRSCAVKRSEQLQCLLLAAKQTSPMRASNSRKLTHDGLWPAARETTRVWTLCGHEQSKARHYRVPSSAFM